MKVLIIGSDHVGRTALTEITKEHSVVIVEVEETERPKEEVFLIQQVPIIENPVDYFPIKEQQPWRQKRKNNWKKKRRK